MPNFPTIDDFFSPKVPPTEECTRAHLYQKQIEPGDGFIVALQARVGDQVVSNASFHHHSISSLKLGMKKVSITGRVVNLWESNQTKASREGNNVRLFQLAIKDDTGIIEVDNFSTRIRGCCRIWLSNHFQSIPVLAKMNIHKICTIYINFVAGLEPVGFSKSNATVPLFISISGEDLNSQLVVHEDTDENLTLYKSLLKNRDGSVIFQLMPLRAFSNAELDTAGLQTLLCIKFIGARKKVPLKNGGTAEKVEVGVFDETTHGILILWGALAACAANWEPGNTILLLTSPNVKFWGSTPQFTITHKSLVEVDPNMRDAGWLREYASRSLGRSSLQQEFPKDFFDWEARLSTSTKTLFRLADIDQYSRQFPKETHVGFLSVLLVDVKLTTLYKRRMLLSGVCCGDIVFSNSPSTPCKRCEKVDVTFRLNPRILGTVTDETGCINGGNLLISDKAWKKLFGRPAEELVNTEIDSLQEIEHRMLFTRITLLFGWSSEIGKLAIWDIMA
ncbi:hypothetical protein EV426DRAFT_639752 [Tirmania nivea]|nr:hypothetical protein EV426DRAFT_639752 [Tirmania nivea]